MRQGLFAAECGDMVRLIRDRGVADERVLAAMAAVERHAFVPDPFVNRAYEDTALPIGHGQTISQPYTVALMTQALQLREGDKVLEVGTGSGYQAAILAAMGMRVFTVERTMPLLAGARKVLDRLGYRVASRGGDGSVGWNEHAPYQGIIVTAAAPDVPKPLVEQLADGGRLVVPVGDMDTQSIVICTRKGDIVERREEYGFKFVPLIGKMGWKRD